MWFSFDGVSYRTHNSAMAAKQRAAKALKWCEQQAHECWPEETTDITWGLIVQQATVTSEREVDPEEDAVDPDIAFIQTIELVGTAMWECTTCGGLMLVTDLPPPNEANES